ncbi:MAG: beta-eliminating lyase-related protein [Ktedonobacteraceae bacterium]
MDTKEKDRIYKACTRFLTHHYRQTPQQVLSELATMPEAELDMDHYGQGEYINWFEKNIAEYLGKEAAVFMPSGTMCQQIALRIWAERRGHPNIAFHPTCHLEIHEQKAYQHLHGLSSILVGSRDHVMTLRDVEAISEPLAALLIELPQREIGGQLPTWEELTAIIDWARQRGIPTHMDGARLWESQPFYSRPYTEIAALFDTVYVSFYKSIGGIAGAALAGPADVIAEARTWQRRHGGNLIHLYPYVLSAHKWLDKRLERMATYYTKAKDIAAILSATPGIEIVPNPPHTNMMHVFLRGEREKLQANALDISEETGIWLFQGLTPTIIPTYQKFELVVGDATLDLSNVEIQGLFQRLLHMSTQVQLW